MPDKFFLSAAGTDVSTPGKGVPASGPGVPEPLPGERVLWSGRCAVAEYAFEEPASLPRWTLPEDTEVVVTETRVIYGDPGRQVAGELRWPWPQHLRVQPGNRDTGRSATVTQIQLVCAGPDGAFPALVFAGGALTKVADADRLANVLRQAIARYRVEHVAELGLTMPQSRMLSRLVIAPEFSNYQGGEGQTVSLLGSTPVELAPVELAPVAPVAATPEVYTGGSYVSQSYETDPWAPEQWEPDPYAADRYPDDPYQDVAYDPTPVSSAGWAPADRPGMTADAVRAQQAQHAELVAQQAQPDLASRAADLAARVANLVAGGTDLDQPLASFETRTTSNLSAYLNPPGETYSTADPPSPSTTNAAERAESIRQTAARFAGNSARARGSMATRTDDEFGAPSHRGLRNF